MRSFVPGGGFNLNISIHSEHPKIQEMDLNEKQKIIESDIKKAQIEPLIMEDTSKTTESKVDR